MIRTVQVLQRPRSVALINFSSLLLGARSANISELRSSLRSTTRQLHTLKAVETQTKQSKVIEFKTAIPSVIHTEPPSKDNYFEDKVNLSCSLPQYQLLITRGEIKDELYKEKLTESEYESYSRGILEINETLVDKSKILYRLAKIYFKFFKLGITNLWRNNRALKKEVFDKYYLLDNGLGQNVDIGKGDFRDKKSVINSDKLDLVTNELLNAIFCSRISKAAKSRKNQQEEQEFAEGKEKETLQDFKDPIAITRSQYQGLLRNRKDFMKLPLFGFLFFLIEELIVPICYVFPSIAPTTCLIPLLLPRYFKQCKEAQRKLTEMREAEKSEESELSNDERLLELKRRTPYSLSSEELSLTVDLLMIDKSFIYRNDDSLRLLLIQRYKEIQVDNYLLARDGGVEQLNKLELLFSCLQRGLVDFEQLFEVEHQLEADKKVSKVSFYDRINGDELREKLQKFVSEMDDTSTKPNTGLLGLATTCK